MLDVTALLRAAGFAGDGVQVLPASAARGSGWATLTQLSGDGRLLRELVEESHELQRDRVGAQVESHVAALWLLQDVAWIHAVLAVGLLETQGVSIRSSPAGLAMELPRDMFFPISFAEEPQVLVAASAAERRELYRSGRAHLAGLLEPLREPMSAHLHTGPRAFWACVTDMATGAISTGCTARPGRLAGALDDFDDHTPPLLSGDHLVDSPAGPIRRRHGCCLLYTVDGMELCHSCPRIVLAGTGED